MRKIRKRIRIHKTQELLGPLHQISPLTAGRICTKCRNFVLSKNRVASLQIITKSRSSLEKAPMEKSAGVSTRSPGLRGPPNSLRRSPLTTQRECKGSRGRSTFLSRWTTKTSWNYTKFMRTKWISILSWTFWKEVSFSTRSSSVQSSLKTMPQK